MVGLESKILVMDDQLLIREVASGILTHLGYRCTTVDEGSRAVELYRSAYLDGDPFDLVLLDVVIPHGMGGIETARILSAINPELKVVAMSGYDPDSFMKEGNNPGFIDFISKPFGIDTMRDMVERVLGEGLHLGGGYSPLPDSTIRVLSDHQ